MAGSRVDDNADEEWRLQGDQALVAATPAPGPEAPEPTADSADAGPQFDVVRARGGLVRVVALVALVGLTITAAAAWAARSLDNRNEARLLRVQTRQVAALISAEVVNITNPLVTALRVATATAGSAEQFTEFMTTQLGPGRPFVDASLWRVEGSSPVLVAETGDAAAPVSSSGAIGDLLSQALSSDSFAVIGLPTGSMTRVAYAMSDHASPGYVVVAERAIPANRQVPVESNAAFSSLHFATYLGDSTRSADLATTDVVPSELPLRGLTDRVTIPFGNTVITIVTARRGRLGGNLEALLPWIFLGVGLLVTTATAIVSVRLVRRRRDAEQDADTIARLYKGLDDRFGEQRHISETLQRALLPQRNPPVRGLEIASRYLAGSRGVEVGGDWYSIVPVDADRFAFVVGDVSGSGLAAAAIMARLRFTLRAYLLEGHLPDRALQMCSREIDVLEDGHFATVLVGVGNPATRELTLANAGHFNPLVITDSSTEFIKTTVGVPLGVAHSSHYELTTYVMPPGSTLIAFTDGLVERRGEDLLRGLQRLAAAASKRESPLDESLTSILAAMDHEGPEDDIAILAFRWVATPTTSHR